MLTVAKNTSRINKTVFGKGGDDPEKRNYYIDKRSHYYDLYYSKNSGSLKKIKFGNIDEIKQKPLKNIVAHSVITIKEEYQTKVCTITWNRVAAKIKTLTNDTEAEEYVPVYIFGNYMRGYETLDSDILIRINNYLNFIASYNSYFDRIHNEYIKLIKIITHNQKVRQDVTEDLLKLNYLEERYNFLLESYDDVILKYNNLILYELLIKLDFTEFRVELGIIEDISDEDLCNIILWSIGSRFTLRDREYVSTYLNIVDNNEEMFTFSKNFNFVYKQKLYLFLVEGRGEINMDLFNIIFRDDIENSLDMFTIGNYNDIDFYAEYKNNTDISDYLEFLDSFFDE